MDIDYKKYLKYKKKYLSLKYDEPQTGGLLFKYQYTKKINAAVQKEMKTIILPILDNDEPYTNKLLNILVNTQNQDQNIKQKILSDLTKIKKINEKKKYIDNLEILFTHNQLTNDNIAKMFINNNIVKLHICTNGKISFQNQCKECFDQTDTVVHTEKCSQESIIKYNLKKIITEYNVKQIVTDLKLEDSCKFIPNTVNLTKLDDFIKYILFIKNTNSLVSTKKTLQTVNICDTIKSNYMGILTFIINSMLLTNDSDIEEKYNIIINKIKENRKNKSKNQKQIITTTESDSNTVIEQTTKPESKTNLLSIQKQDIESTSLRPLFASIKNNELTQSVKPDTVKITSTTSSDSITNNKPVPVTQTVKPVSVTQTVKPDIESISLQPLFASIKNNELTQTVKPVIETTSLRPLFASIKNNELTQSVKPDTVKITSTTSSDSITNDKPSLKKIVKKIKPIFKLQKQQSLPDLQIKVEQKVKEKQNNAIKLFKELKKKSSDQKIIQEEKISSNNSPYNTTNSTPQNIVNYIEKVTNNVINKTNLSDIEKNKLIQTLNGKKSDLQNILSQNKKEIDRINESIKLITDEINKQDTLTIEVKKYLNDNITKKSKVLEDIFKPLSLKNKYFSKGGFNEDHRKIIILYIYYFIIKNINNNALSIKK
jgi:hypothetical protein